MCKKVLTFRDVDTGKKNTAIRVTSFKNDVDIRTVLVSNNICFGKNKL